MLLIKDTSYITRATAMDILPSGELTIARRIMYASKATSRPLCLRNCGSYAPISAPNVAPTVLAMTEKRKSLVGTNLDPYGVTNCDAVAALHFGDSVGGLTETAGRCTDISVIANREMSELGTILPMDLTLLQSVKVKASLDGILT